MAARKAVPKPKSKTDPHFMPNLVAAIREEAKKGALSARVESASPGPGDGGDEDVGRGYAGAEAEGSPAPAGRRGSRQDEEAAQALDREGLLKELRSLLPKLDAEGLDFLLRQAKVHLYNMDVERLNSAREVRTTRGAASEKPAAQGPKLRLERSSSGSSYYVWAGGDSTMFTSEEMLAIVRLAFGHGDEAESARAIGTWLGRERRDALEGLVLPGARGPALLELARLLRSSFRAPK